jgi:hypothetical protein
MTDTVFWQVLKVLVVINAQISTSRRKKKLAKDRRSAAEE